MICSLLPSTNCTTLEYQRWNAMLLWISRYPDLKFTGPSLSAFLDRLVNKARAYMPRLFFDQVSLSISRNDFSMDTYRSNKTSVYFNQTDFSFIALNSSQLRIDIQNKMNGFSSSAIVLVNFTFYLPKGSNPSVLKYTYIPSSVNSTKG